MSQGGPNGKDRAPNPWPDEPTPVEPPPIREHETIVYTLGLVCNRLDNLRQEVRDLMRAYRLARTPLGDEITGEIVRCLDAGFDDLRQTVIKAVAGK